MGFAALYPSYKKEKPEAAAHPAFQLEYDVAYFRLSIAT